MNGKKEKTTRVGEILKFIKRLLPVDIYLAMSHLKTLTIEFVQQWREDSINPSWQRRSLNIFG
jgi:hypothetical protein